MEEPIILLKKWLKDSENTKDPDWNAMSLATVGKDGRPSVRIVLCKNVIDEKLIFYTNYESKKAKELEENPAVALCFFGQYLKDKSELKARSNKRPHHNLKSILNRDLSILK